MDKNFKNQGFAPIAIILIVVALIAVGGGAYYMVTQQNSASKQGDETSDTEAGALPEAKNQTAETPKTANQPESDKNSLTAENQNISPEPQNETAAWKTYQNDFFKYEFQYPSEFVIVEQDNYSIGIVNTSSCKNQGDSKIIPPGCWKIYSKVVDNVGSISGRYVKKYDINIQGIKGVRTELVSQYDAGFSNIIVEVNKNNKWYVLGANFNLDDEKIVRSVFDKILSTFKFTGQYIPIPPTAEQQNVISYLEANITELVKTKPVLGSAKWYIYNVYFYDPDKIIVGFEDGHITGGFIGSYSVNGNIVLVQYIDEIMNTGNEINQLSSKYNLPPNKAIKYTRTSNSGFELVK